MSIRYPAPLRPGDTIGVTAPSSGVDAGMMARLEHNATWLRDRGFDVRLGECLSGERVVSGTKEKRAAELMDMLRDPAVRAIAPPWGGELAIDLVDQLDWDEIATLEPTWVLGYSDMSTVLLPLLLRAGWASIHGTNLMESSYAVADGLLHWTDIASRTEAFTQRSPGRFQRVRHDDWRVDPGIDEMTLDAEGTWTLVGGGGLDVTGRLVGGCIEVLSPLAGTSYGDVAAFGEQHAGDGLVVYLEAAEWGAYEICRSLHGLRLAGWFDQATAILIARTHAPGESDLSQHDAVRDALGMLDLPIVLDVEVGHVQPFLPLVNGALARVVIDGERREITQELV